MSYTKTVIIVEWRITKRIEVYKDLASLYKTHNKEILGVKRAKLYYSDLKDYGYENEIVNIKKRKII